MRIACFSPLPPAESGIADYSAELLPYLAQLADITLFFDPRQPPEPWLVEQFRADEIDRFPARRHEFDIPLYHMGNDAAYHEAIWHTLRAHPGIVVVHETVFYHLFHEITVSRGDVERFRRMLQETYGQVAAERAMTHLDDWTANPVAFPLLEPVVRGALGVIVHNRYAAKQVAERCPEVPVAVVPHHLSLPAPFDGPVDRGAIRRALDLIDRFVVGSFGLLTESKRLPAALRAFACLRHSRPEAVYCLVGDVHPNLDLEALITQAGLPAEAVRITGRLPLDQFLSYMVATDVALNLRYPTAGETSGTLIRLLGLGVPTIVTEVGAFAEFPEDVVARVPVDGFEEETLAAILQALAEDETLRRTMGTNAREYARTHHSLEGSARAYCDFIARVLAGETRPFGSEVLSPASHTLTHVAATLAGWGVTEYDDALLEPVARAMVEIGLSPIKN